MNIIFYFDIPVVLIDEILNVFPKYYLGNINLGVFAVNIMIIFYYIGK